MAKVELRQVSRRYGKTSAIEEISLKIADGEFCVLVGPSGCGKSTLLRAIAGLETVTEGGIYIADQLVNDIPARDRDVAMVFQNYALYPHLSVAENLGFGLKMRKTPPETIQQQVQKIAQSLGITHLLNRKPKQLSGGQQQRVALGRAIIRQPQAFLLDEPLSNLDAQLREETRAELKRLHQELGITTIYVTHDQGEAMTLAEQLVVLEQGHIQQIGTPDTVYRFPANQMVAGFLGSPPMNFLLVKYAEGQFHCGEQSLVSPDRIEQSLDLNAEKTFSLGIRPEAISVADASSQEHLETLKVKIDLIEPLGRETLLRGQVLGTDESLNFLVSGIWQGQRGEHLSVNVDVNQLLIFRQTNGERLYPKN
ncbi:carbohydrate ABC transporter ATP-binding protein, CUT1 family [Halothece sp. PCC 7418]|uniref:ABC transporter ATP-binding protein n=1 Tax=Halothece sp. (strain PCC 7418) TaxID=65093 RepID=UPI0002A0886B|nr:sn-glycerol-3-phosphate ABC transporter ATP-binding protein UgpC [Halothece sp. PCC 7418]AFZ42483.1 carbohydrate ABC transporter ATP-binding protein, CUT1 family [Halothece sp. PCC 7418]